VISEARALRAQGLSLRAVAARLRSIGFRSRTGRGFAAAQVKRMVAPPRSEVRCPSDIGADAVRALLTYALDRLDAGGRGRKGR
jgi:hypothetical protein